MYFKLNLQKYRKAIQCPKKQKALFIALMAGAAKFNPR